MMWFAKSVVLGGVLTFLVLEAKSLYLEIKIRLTRERAKAPQKP